MTFPKNRFCATLTTILSFCVKCKNAMISEMVRDREVSLKFLIRRVSAESTGSFSQKSLSRHFFGGHLEFLSKHKNAFISETMRDRAISTKFLIHRVSAESTGDFSNKLFSRHFCSHLEFLRKNAKSHLSG